MSASMPGSGSVHEPGLVAVTPGSGAIRIAPVEHPLRGELRSEQIAAGGVLNALRLAGGARGVEQVERVLRIDPLRLAGLRLALDGVVPPEVALRVHGDRLAGSLEHDDTLDALAVAGKRLVGGRLESDHVARGQAAIGRSH